MWKGWQCQNRTQDTWLEPPVLCHWATVTKQPPALTILYVYCTGGTEMPQSHILAATQYVLSELGQGLTTSNIEDCEGWWLSGCCSSVAEHWLHKPGILGSIPGDCQPFHSLFHLKISKNLIILTWGKSSKHFVVLSVWREAYLVPTWAWKITCRRFNWMLLLSSGRKWMTGAFSWNVDMLFSELKLVPDNLFFIYAEANWEATEMSVYMVHASHREI